MFLGERDNLPQKIDKVFAQLVGIDIVIVCKVSTYFFQGQFLGGSRESTGDVIGNFLEIFLTEFINTLFGVSNNFGGIFLLSTVAFK